MEDRTKWPAGPWDDEPNKVQWVDKETGLDCLIIRNSHTGILCGYVGVAASHRLYGCDYEAPEVEVHGGLTYANRRQDHICHTPEAPRPEDVWWFGFDCGHAWDLMPAMMQYSIISKGTVYRDISFVRQECESLARQLKETA